MVPVRCNGKAVVWIAKSTALWRRRIRLDARAAGVTWDCGRLGTVTAAEVPTAPTNRARLVRGMLIRRDFVMYVGSPLGARQLRPRGRRCSEWMPGSATVSGALTGPGLLRDKASCRRNWGAADETPSARRLVPIGPDFTPKGGISPGVSRLSAVAA